MNICFIANGRSPHTRNWIEPLIDKVGMVYLISYKPVNTNIQGTKTIDLTRITQFPKLKYLLWGLWIRKYLQKITPDILHTHQIQPSGWLGLLSGFQPLVVSAWGSDLFSLASSLNVRKYLNHQVVTRCASFTVPSKYMYKTALDYGVPRERISHIPWGIDRKIFTDSVKDRNNTRQELDFAPDKPVILSTRAVTKNYNQDILLSACKELRNSRYDFQLVLIRFNPEAGFLSKLENFIEENNLSPQVKWLEPIRNPTSMAKLYRAADVTVSLPNSEGYGVSVYEAMASGCPTIITDLKVFNDLSHEFHTLFVPCGDIKATENAIIRILTDRKIKQSIVQHGIKFTDTMDQSIQAEKALDLYQKLI